METTTPPTQNASLMAGTVPVIQEHIVATPGTCGGKPRIAGSRIRVKDVAVMHERQGMSPAEIVRDFPHLTLADIYAALTYYHDHREQINADIRAEREWYEEMKAKSPSLLREKLKAREIHAPDNTLPSG